MKKEFTINSSSQICSAEHHMEKYPGIHALIVITSLIDVLFIYKKIITQ